MIQPQRLHHHRYCLQHPNSDKWTTCSSQSHSKVRTRSFFFDLKKKKKENLFPSSFSPPISEQFPAPGFLCTVLEEDVFTAHLTWGLCSKTAASNICSNDISHFRFSLQTTEDVIIHCSLHPSCSTATETQCTKSSSVFHCSVRFDPLPDFPAAPQRRYKIFISILIVFFHSLSFEVNAVMSDCSESCANPLPALWSHQHADTFVFRSTQSSFWIINLIHVITHLAQPPSDKPLTWLAVETARHWLVSQQIWLNPSETCQVFNWQNKPRRVKLHL